MNFGTNASYPNNASSNFLSTEIISTIRPEAEEPSKKKMPKLAGVNEPTDLIIDDAWAPIAPFLDAMQEAASGVDEYLCVRYWNTPMARLTGVSREDAMHRPLFSLLPRDFERHLATNLRRLFSRHEAGSASTADVVEGEFSQRHGNSEFFDFSYRMRVLPTAGNSDLAIITLRPASEGRSRQRRQQQDPYGVLGKLSASLVQELANPLDNICSKIDNILALTGNNWDQRLDGELHSIITEVYRISHLINNILTLSCNSASNSVQVNLNNLILEAISLLEHTLNRKIACTTMLLPDLPPVAGDPVLLHCVFQNILRYAVEASGEDAVPKIQTALGELPPPVPLFSSSTDEPKNGQARQNPTPKDVDKKGKEPSRQIIVRIEDRGPEMAPEALAQLFEPFFTSKTFGIGVGLGLFISKRIIEFHRGQIQVSGESGRGTIFTIILPI